MVTNSKKNIPCPDCQAILELVPKPGNPARLVAYHNCCGRGNRTVYETDAPAFPPPYLVDRIQPSEFVPKKKEK